MQRLNCERYPCHFPDQDCALCFCPFYPCRDERTGGFLDKGEWSCSNCTLIHKKEVSDAVLDALVMRGELRAAWKKLERYL